MSVKKKDPEPEKWIKMMERVQHRHFDQVITVYNTCSKVGWTWVDWSSKWLYRFSMRRKTATFWCLFRSHFLFRSDLFVRAGCIRSLCIWAKSCPYCTQRSPMTPVAPMVRRCRSRTPVALSPAPWRIACGALQKALLSASLLFFFFGCDNADFKMMRIIVMKCYE